MIQPEIVITIIVYFAVLIFIGARASRIINNAEDYFIAGRNLGFLSFMLLVIASIVSGMTILGASGLAYVTGWPSMWEPIFVCLGVSLLMVLFGAKLYGISRKFKYYTVQDYLAHRYDSPRTVRSISAVAGIIISFIYLVGQFTAISIILGWVLQIEHIHALAISSIIVTIYVLLGGLHAIANTTKIQGITLLIGSIIIGPLVIKGAGGLTAVNEKLASINPDFIAAAYPQMHPPAEGFAFLTPVFLVSFFFLLTFGLATAPHALNNILAARKASYFRWAPFWAFVIYLVAFYLIKMSGFAARVMVEEGIISIPHPDYAIVAAVQHLTPPLIWALFSVIVLSAVMSTTDRLMLTISTLYSWDLHRRLFNPEIGDKKLKLISRGVVLLTGILAFVAAINPPELLAWLIWMGIGLMLSAFCVPLLAGLYWRRANRHGAIWSMLIGLTIAVAGGYLHQFVTPLPVHFSFFGFLSSLAAMIIFSLATAPPSRELLDETRTGFFIRG